MHKLLTDEELLIEIAKALHGKPDPSVLKEYKTYENFWVEMATSPAVSRLFDLINTQKLIYADLPLTFNSNENTNNILEELTKHKTTIRREKKGESTFMEVVPLDKIREILNG